MNFDEQFENQMIQLSLPEVDKYLDGVKCGMKISMKEHGQYILDKFPQKPLFPPMLQSFQLGLKS